MRLAAFCLALYIVPGAMSQDERQVTSPNGEIEFRIFIVGSQKDTTFSRLAYQMSANGRIVVKPSFMGIYIYEEEPILGENVGLISVDVPATAKYRSAVLHYMQNGSTGRGLNIEVRVYNEGVAFRYIVPRSALLENIIVGEELTEFRIAGAKAEGRKTLPAKIGSATVAEVKKEGWSPMALIEDDSAWVSTLSDSRDQPQAAFTGTTPVTGPWRIIGIRNISAVLEDLRQ